MPRTESLDARQNAILGEAIDRRDRGKERHEELLPPDFARQVLDAARGEADRLNAWLGKVDTAQDRAVGAGDGDAPVLHAAPQARHHRQGQLTAFAPRTPLGPPVLRDPGERGEGRGGGSGIVGLMQRTSAP